jgi:hypothetical protein
MQPVIIALLASNFAWAAPCPPGADWTESVLKTAQVVLSTWEQDDDPESFISSLVLVRDLLPCVRKPLRPDEVWLVHESMGYGEWVRERPPTSARSFWALHQLRPDWEPVRRQIPAANGSGGSYTHPIDMLTDSRPDTAGRRKLSWAPRGGGYRVDGHEDATIPLSRAFVLQAFDADNKIVLTKYVWTAESVRRLGPRTWWRRPLRRTSTGVAIAAGVVSLAAGAVSWSDARRARDPDTSSSQRPAFRNRGNALFVLCISSTVAGSLQFGSIHLLTRGGVR